MTYAADLFDRQIVVAPMAGGPTTPQLVAGAASSGALGFLAGGYKQAAELEADIRAVRDLTDEPFGVNVFVPGRPTADRGVVERYLRQLDDDAAALGVGVGEARWDDDDWRAKVELLTVIAPAVVSFTFGLPPRDIVRRLRQRDCLVMITVTNRAEAAAAGDAGADLLCAQGVEAGAHRGTFDDAAPDDELSTLDLVAAIASTLDLPVVAAGGVATPAHVSDAVAAGAVAVQLGTAFLRCHEAGTNAVHRAALEDERRVATTMTRAFTGRRARGLVNDFTRRHGHAPSAYPEIHHATRPLRAAAAVTGDAERLHLWAGTGFRHTRAEPAAVIIDWLRSGI